MPTLLVEGADYICLNNRQPRHIPTKESDSICSNGLKLPGTFTHTQLIFDAYLFDRMGPAYRFQALAVAPILKNNKI